MITRYASAVTSGTVITFGLLYVMQLLITLQPGVASEPRKHIGIGWIKQRIPEPPVIRPEEMIDKRKLTEPNVPPARQSSKGGKESISVPGPGPVLPPGLGTPTFGEVLDGPLVALVRVSPVYPAKARANGIEGSVVVQFDVTELGYAVNVVVLESTNRLFDKAAIAAAKRFKYKARVVNGQALPTYGVRNLFTFQMDD
jgi:periplasmic protein TonB